jgi:NADH:ubiquinone oxidoreductase subunit C
MNGIDFDAIPGFVNRRDAHGETTVIVATERLVEAATHMRDELGYRFLADIAAADYLGWGEKGVAGYWGSPPPDAGRGWEPEARDLNAPGSAGLEKAPEPKPKRFSVSYHLLRITPAPQRIRLQVWCDDGEPVPSVVGIWPTADWHEREAWDMLGIPVEGHPNLTRILMEDDWEGHPLRKDYPIGGEPVRFSDEE